MIIFEYLNTQLLFTPISPKIRELQAAITAFEQKSFWYPTMHKIESLVQDILRDQSIEDKQKHLHPLIFRVQAAIDRSQYNKFFSAVRAFFRMGAFGEGSLTAQQRILDGYKTQILQGGEFSWKVSKDLGELNNRFWKSVQILQAPLLMIVFVRTLTETVKSTIRVPRFLGKVRIRFP
jgi:hypothetical protein